MSTDKIVIVALPNYWNKTRLTVGIVDTKSTKLVSTRQYHDLVVDAIDTWQRTLNKFGTENKEFSNLTDIAFDVSENVTGKEDIIIQWWFSNPKNGETRFAPMMDRIDRVEVFIAKCNGSDVPNMDDFREQQHGIPIIRTPEQIKSVILHEFGHVLGLGHCSYYKDVMYTGATNPDINRQISSLDLQIISQSLKITTQNQTSIPLSISTNQWKSVQI